MCVTNLGVRTFYSAVLGRAPRVLRLSVLFLSPPTHPYSTRGHSLTLNVVVVLGWQLALMILEAQVAQP